MIEVTDEMVYAFAGEPEITATDAHAIRVGLAAVLTIVERDCAGQPRIREWPPGRGAQHPHFCVSCSDGESRGPGCINCRSTGMDQSPWTDCEQCRIPRRVKLP